MTVLSKPTRKIIRHNHTTVKLILFLWPTSTGRRTSLSGPRLELSAASEIINAIPGFYGTMQYKSSFGPVETKE